MSTDNEIFLEDKNYIILRNGSVSDVVEIKEIKDQAINKAKEKSARWIGDVIEVYQVVKIYSCTSERKIDFKETNHESDLKVTQYET